MSRVEKIFTLNVRKIIQGFVFSKCMCIYLFFLFVNRLFFYLLFSALNIFQGFSLNFINQIARSLGRAVDKLLNGSFTRTVYFWKTKLVFASGHFLE